MSSRRQSKANADAFAFSDRHQDYFLAHTLLAFVRMDWWVYLQAVEHFFGRVLEPGKIVSAAAAGGHVSRQELSDDEEYALLWSILANQHEHCHFFQFLSTACGIYHFFLDAWYWDFMKEFIGRGHRVLSAVSPGSRPQLPISTSLAALTCSHGPWADDMRFGAAVRELFHAQMRLFDDTSLTKGQAVEQWNTFAEFQDTLSKLPGDNVGLPRLAEPHDPDAPANPGSITFRSLIESSAHCGDFANLKSLTASMKLRIRFMAEACTPEYTALIELVQEVVEPSLVYRVVSRLAGIALQTPLTTLHWPPGESGARLGWDDLAPTQRFARLFRELKEGRIAAASLVQDAAAPDDICMRLRWPRPSEMMRNFSRQTTFHGLNPTVGFVFDKHRSFCEFALANTAKPVWMLDVFWSPDQSAERFAESFYPPWQFAGSELVLHETCDIDVMLGTCHGFLTTIAAREMFENDCFDETMRHLRTIAKWFEQGNDPDLIAAFERQWHDAFVSTFGFAMSDVQQVNTDRKE